MDFTSLGINKELVDILKNNGITEAMPVQEKAIPELLAGQDIIAQAQTGTGKTLAFLLPILQKINPDAEYTQALIITPTRELALQITNVIRELTEGSKIKMLAVYGGQDIERQMKKLNGGAHIVIGTPGRLNDHIRRQSVNLKRVKMLVLDEADEMLDMGFSKEVEEIIHESSPNNRQTLLFSATITRATRMLSAKHLKNPAQVQIQAKTVTIDTIKQTAVQTSDNGKLDALIKIIEEENPFMSIIFCKTKARASALNSDLQSRGYNCEELHGDITQGKRQKIMKAFRDTDIHFLIATDIAARGLDIEGVTHIFNYDVPDDVEWYIHRVGRTGRAGESGKAFTFVTQKDVHMLSIIESAINTKMERRRISGDAFSKKESTDRITKLESLQRGSGYGRKNLGKASIANSRGGRNAGFKGKTKGPKTSIKKPR